MPVIRRQSTTAPLAISTAVVTSVAPLENFGPENFSAALTGAEFSESALNELLENHTSSEWRAMLGQFLRSNHRAVFEDGMTYVLPRVYSSTEESYSLEIVFHRGVAGTAPEELLFRIMLYRGNEIPSSGSFCRLSLVGPATEAWKWEPSSDRNLCEALLAIMRRIVETSGKLRIAD
jgi:hypothetical protein